MGDVELTTLLRGLTVTKVVFELEKIHHLAFGMMRLTVTKVVFE